MNCPLLLIIPLAVYCLGSFPEELGKRGVPGQSTSSDEASNTPESSLAKTAKLIRKTLVPICIEDSSIKPQIIKNGKGYKIDGTGFFVHRSGIVATAGHVTEGVAKFIIYKGNVYECEVIKNNLILTYGSAPPLKRLVWDIGLLQAKGIDSPPSPAILSTRVSFVPGEGLAVYGYYDRGTTIQVEGQDHIAALLTKGIVSATFSISFGGQEFGSRLVLDITAGPGSSGSPVFDPKTGEVVGIVTSVKGKRILVPSNGNTPVLGWLSMNITDAEPIVQLRMILDTLD